MMSPPDLSRPEAVAERLGAIAVAAGRLLACVTDRRAGHVLKPDGSPSTAADLASEELILRELRATWPAVPVVAEETASAAAPGELFFLVDPLDGTKDYLSGAGEYSVNIALVRGRRPVAAALAAPAEGRVWTAGTAATVASFDAPSRREPVRTRAGTRAGLVVLGSRRHGDPETEAALAQLDVGRTLTVSSAAKFGRLASGEADLYLRCGPTMEWDTAAGDHLVTCAGGIVVGPAGDPLTYGHVGRGYRNGAFAVFGNPDLVAGFRFGDAQPLIRPA